MSASAKTLAQAVQVSRLQVENCMFCGRRRPMDLMPCMGCGARPTVGAQPTSVEPVPHKKQIPVPLKPKDRLE